MMKKSKLTARIILLCALYSALPIALGAMNLSFEQAVRITRDNNESLRAAQLEEKQNEQARLAARGLFFPKVDLWASYTRLDNDITLDLDPIREAIVGIETIKNPAFGHQVDMMLPSFEQTVQKDTFGLATVNVTWPVFTGGKILAANRAAAALHTESTEKLHDVEAGLISELSERYFGLRFSLRVVDVRREIFEGMQEHLDQARKLEQNGMIAKADRLHAQVASAEAERQLKKALRDVELARTALNNSLGTGERIEPTSPLFLVRELEPLSYFRMRALANSPVLKQIDARHETVHQQFKKELAGWFPDVFLMGFRQIDDHDFTSYAPEWSVGLLANFTLFDGMARSHRISAARYAQERVAAFEGKTRLDIEALVEKTYNELLTSLEQYDALQTSYDYADEYVRVRQRAFQEGYATSLDVVDAELYLSQIKVDRLKTLYEFDMNLARLLAVCGESERFQAYFSRGKQEGQF